MATITKGKTFSNGELVTPASLHALVDSATVANIVNADISASAAIADTKLATISTPGKVLPAAVQGTAVITTDSRLSDARTPTLHVHDDRYYQKTETNILLDGKQPLGSYAPTTHTHDDRYYTETEINTLLAGKQAAGSYAPASGIAPSAITGTAVITADSRLSDARTPTTHNHNDLYYTEAEMATLLAGKQAAGSYAPATGISPTAIAGTAVITTDSRLSDTRTPVDASVTTVKLAAATQQLLVPTGAVMPFAKTTAPAGWLMANGDAVPNGSGTVQGVAADYSALYAAVGTNFGAAGKLPDLRGIFVRGSGSQTINGISYSGTLGTKQGDAMQGHAHTSTTGGALVAANGSAYGGLGEANTGSPVSDGTNGTPRTGAETRPANIALLYCIKI
jgi:hypothetical protein